ncbi:hypothetical protein R5R35_014492 [Gryllus longicercus]|uniref:EGF-like domain-containing protein n=1 Tax=Gryllus longicercus TaxID=2509291 RepID=A0AAN9V4K3_9ORTH
MSLTSTLHCEIPLSAEKKCPYFFLTAGQCRDSTCGPNAKCASTGRQCVCSPGYYGRPPFKQCRLESDPECINDVGCPDNQACRDRLCLSPCGWTCSPDHRCIVQNHKAKCGPSIYPTAAPRPVA